MAMRAAIKAWKAFERRCAFGRADELDVACVKLAYLSGYADSCTHGDAYAEAMNAVNETQKRIDELRGPNG